MRCKLQPPLPDALRRGDTVTATYEGRSVLATVEVASPNGRSLIIMWDDGMLGGHCGAMPVLGTEHGYWSLIERKPVELKRLRPG